MGVMGPGHGAPVTNMVTNNAMGAGHMIHQDSPINGNIGLAPMGGTVVPTVPTGPKSESPEVGGYGGSGFASQAIVGTSGGSDGAGEGGQQDVEYGAGSSGVAGDGVSQFVSSACPRILRNLIPGFPGPSIWHDTSWCEHIWSKFPGSWRSWRSWRALRSPWQR